MSHELRLTMELVPSPLWNKSLAKLLPKNKWRSLRESIIDEQGRKCEICGNSTDNVFLHEVWHYDDHNHIQRLHELRLVCFMCNRIVHFGFTGVLYQQGKLTDDQLQDVIQHFLNVNQCTEDDFDRHMHEQFDLWEERSRHQWTQNLGQYSYLLKS